MSTGCHDAELVSEETSIYTFRTTNESLGQSHQIRLKWQTSLCTYIVCITDHLYCIVSPLWKLDCHHRSTETSQL